MRPDIAAQARRRALPRSRRICQIVTVMFGISVLTNAQDSPLAHFTLAGLPGWQVFPVGRSFTLESSRSASLSRWSLPSWSLSRWQFP
jgi:hypothetical protein